MFSDRSRAPATTNRVAEAHARLRAEGRELLDLTTGNPTRAGIHHDPRRIGSALASAASATYEPESLGLASARGAVSALWKERGFRVPPERIALTSSTSEAYSMLFKILADPGDSVLVPEPSYPLFEHLATYEGIRAVPYRLVHDGAWYVDLDSVKRALTPDTRAVLSVSPNNPTGSFLKRSELRELASFGLPLVSDEVFGAYALGEDDTRARSALEAEDALVFALDGLSKLCALPQMKLAWTAIGGPGPLVQAALERLELVLDAYLSPGSPVQHALPALLEEGADARRAIQSRTARNLDALRRLASGSAVTPLHVEGGWYAPLRLPSTKSDEDWTLELLDRANVAVQPGYFFDFADDAHVVVSLLTPPETFDEGVRRLVLHVSADG